MAKIRYSIIQKMETVWKLSKNTIKEVSDATGIPTGTIRQWQKNYDKISNEYYKYIHDEGIHKLLVAQNRAADKIYELVNAMSSEKIKAAPLNQLASALGILVDRFLRIHDAKEIEEATDKNRYVIEYYDASTGKIVETPPWATDDSIDESALHDSYLWQTLWENRIGEARHNGNGSEGHDDMVARSHLSDGESGLARFEDDDEERDWYPD